MSTVNSSTTPQLLVAANGARTSLTIQNTDANELFLGPTADVSTTNYSFRRPFGTGYNFTPPDAGQDWYGVWDAAGDDGAVITEIFTPLAGENSAIRTYEELKGVIAAWLRPNSNASDDMVANIPKYIGLAEAEMNRRLFVGNQMQTATLAIVDGEAAVPSGFRQVLSMRLTESPWNNISFGDAPAPDTGAPGETGKPTNARRVGNLFIFQPPTSAGASMVYKVGISPLESDDDTNWLLASHPDAYLYGALKHADRRLAGERLGGWIEEFEKVMAEIREEAVMAALATMYIRPSGGVV